MKSPINASEQDDNCAYGVSRAMGYRVYVVTIANDVDCNNKSLCGAKASDLMSRAIRFMGTLSYLAEAS